MKLSCLNVINVPVLSSFRSKLETLDRDVKVQASRLGECTGARKKHAENAREFDARARETSAELEWDDEEIDTQQGRGQEGRGAPKAPKGVTSDPNVISTF